MFRFVGVQHRTVIVFLLLFIGVVVSGCAARAPAWAVRPDDIPTNWIAVEADGVFALWAPAGMRYRRERGVDSWVGTFEGPNFTISMDYGTFAPPFRQIRRDSRNATETVAVDGKEAILLVGPQDGCQGMGVDIDILGLGYLAIADTEEERKRQIASGEAAEMTLWLNTCVRNSDEANLVKSIYRTVRFAPTHDDMGPARTSLK